MESLFIFVYFLKENKIRNKTLKVTLFLRKNMSTKNESKSRNQITYWEGITK